MKFFSVTTASALVALSALSSSVLAIPSVRAATPDPADAAMRARHHYLANVQARSPAAARELGSAGPARRVKKGRRGGTCKARQTTTTAVTASTTVSAAPQTTSNDGSQLNNNPPSGKCFPSAGFTPPSGTPSTSLDDWWCSQDTEEAGFYGFTYAVFTCPSKAQMTADFKQMRDSYGARYVRQYGNCPDEPADMLDNMVEAAYANGMGLAATLWLGWDTSDTTWKARKTHMEATIKNNPLAPYVIRSVDVGTEPLMDQPVDPSSVLIPMIKEFKALCEPKGIQVGISELRYSYGLVSSSIASQIFKLDDYVHAHELPYLSGKATTGDAAWPGLQADLKWFSQQSGGQKITIMETGWPRNTAEWKSASKAAVASQSSQQGWLSVLNDHCEDMKSVAGHGGVGWFWSTWNDGDIPGYGVVNSNGKAVFDFKGVTC